MKITFDKYQNFKKGISFFGTHKGTCVFVIVSALFAGLLPLAAPVVEGLLLANVSVDTGKVIKFGAWLMAVIILSEVAFFLFNFSYAKLISKVSCEIKFALVKTLPRLKANVLNHSTTGTFTTRINVDADELAKSYVSAVSGIVNVLCNIIFVFFLFVVNVWLGLFTLAGLLLMLLIENVRISVWRTGRKKILIQREETEAATNEIILGAKEVKMLGEFDFGLKKVEKELEQSQKLFFNETVKQSAFTNSSGVLGAVVSFLFIVIGIMLIDAEMLTISAFLVVYVYRSKTDLFLSDLIEIKSKFAQGELAATRIFAVLDGEKEFVHDEWGDVSLKRVKGKIEFKNVSFEYLKGKSVLKNVNFVIQPKTCVALVGESGVGKSTILSLIARLFDPASGSVEIDGVNVKTLTHKSMRSCVSFVTEEPFLFGASIKENLLKACPNASHEEIVSACKLAQIHEFVSSKVNGYDTIISSLGSSLSAGERQRLAIARALLKKSKILLLDEATSNLDETNQKLISKALSAISKNHTVVIVCHDKITLEFVDQVFFVKNKKVRRKKAS